MQNRAASLPRARTLVHPGPGKAVRIEHMQAGRGQHFRLALPPGRSIHESIVGALTGEGVHAASMTLLDGELATLSYCLAGPDSSGRTVARYSPPQVLHGARLVFGNATLGQSPGGAPVVHCHAAFRHGDGSVRGGHLLTEQCIVGRGTLTVLATSLDGFDLRIGYDEETRMPLMRPQPETGHV